MGRFEDLVDALEAGDTTAAEALRSEFGVSTLREKAESATANAEKYEAALPLIRQAQVSELLGQLDDDHKAVGLSASDFGEFDPGSLTLDMVKDKAKSKLDEVQASKLTYAQEAGFDNVEEFEQAMAAAKEQKAQQLQGMEKVAGGVASSGGTPSGTEGDTKFDVTKNTFEASKKAGANDRDAMADAIGALIEFQEAGAE